jgi:putative polyketide hydroxylase
MPATVTTTDPATDPTRPAVLIVGAGPAGLVTAIELARQGVRPLVVERHPSTSIFPRATGVSTRSMEIFRGYGIDEAVRLGGWGIIPRQAVVRRLDERDPMETPLGFPEVAASLAVSPVSAVVSPQDHLEPVLVDHLRSLGGEVRFSTELVGFHQDAEAVAVTIRDRARDAETTLRVAYLVGADGHASTVRTTLGIAMEGPADLGRYLSLLFRADLSDVLGAKRYGLYNIGEPGAGGPPTVVVPSGADDRYVLAIPLPPGMDDAAVAAAFPLARCEALIREAAGRPTLEVELLATSTFAFAAQVAERWRDGRVILVGDAAHRMTPRGGRGMNTAIADGHDLGWKLGAVVRGYAGARLLDSYELERGPIGRRNVALSMAEGGGGTDDGLLEDLGPLDAKVGQRLPHVWLGAGEGRRSTLDLLDAGLLLLTAGARTAWDAAAGLIDADVPLHVVPVEGDAFARAYGLQAGGAVLVRPDGMIAWRAERLPEQPADALRMAVDVALARDLAGASGARPTVSDPRASQADAGDRPRPQPSRRITAGSVLLAGLRNLALALWPSAVVLSSSGVAMRGR